MDNIKLNTVEEALEDFRKGEFVIVVDDEDRENEGDLIIAAELITPEKVNFMLKHARGVLCALQVFPLPTAPLLSALWQTLLQHPKHSVAQDTSTRFMLKTKVYCAVPDILKPL